MTCFARMASFALLAGLAMASAAWSAEPLQLEAKIPLGPVAGRIDHLAYDPRSRLLFVAELGNDSVGIVDLEAGKLLRRLHGLSEPQGVAYHAATATLHVANAGDGSLRLFQAYRGSDHFAPVGTIALGDDADNIRFDPVRNLMVVGYGKGALALIDPTSRMKVGDIPLKGHPESFQFDEGGGRIFANVPDARQIAVVDLALGKQTSSIELRSARSNFPMAVDRDSHRLLVGTRKPSRVLVFDTQTGRQLGGSDTCSDADDLFVDPRRQRIYVTCGEGIVDVFARHGDGYESIGRQRTVAGARTSLFSVDTDRLYVAVRANGGEPAAIWVLRPIP